MKIIIIILCHLVNLQAEEIESGEIKFSYGFLGKLQANANPDSIVELFYDSIIQTNDKIRVNAGYLRNTHFYLVYNGSMGEYVKLYSESFNIHNNTATTIDTLFTTVLHWSEMTDPPGDEAFYLINSLRPLTDLTKLLNRYENAPEKGKARLAKKIQTLLDDLDPNKKEELSSLASRLDKPLVGGVAFRGDEDDELKDLSLTHYCKGNNGIAYQKIVLQHK